MILQLDAIHQYNPFMGGIDQLNGNILECRIVIRVKNGLFLSYFG